MSEKTYNVLFLCTRNSARSIMAEGLLNAYSNGRFKAYSAGSHPSGEVHQYAVELMRINRLTVSHLRSKSWDEFAGPSAPPLDFVFTVCDRAAREVCPVWPGQPMTAHWGVEDPVSFAGSEEEQRRAFFRTYAHLSNRILIFTSLPIAKLDKLALKRKLDDIGKR